MASVRRSLLVVFVLLGIGVVAFGIVFVPQLVREPAVPDNRIVVGASIFPIADIVQNIGGELVRSVTIIPPGVSEHSYRLTVQQVADLKNARIVFTVGSGIEGPDITSFINESGAEVVEVSRGISFRTFQEAQAEQNVDPHYWLSVPNAQIIAQTITDALVRVDPLNKEEYQRNARAYQEGLVALENELQMLAKTVRQKKFIAMHDAWSYFADQYDFDLVATYEPVEGKEPALADLNRLKETAMRYGITTFYTEPQKATTAATRFVSEELGLVIRVLDPAGGIDSKMSYITLMRENMKAIVEGSR